MRSITQTRFLSARGCLRTAMATGLCCGILALPSPAAVQAQDIADDAPDQIEDRLSPGNVEDRVGGRAPGDNDGRAAEQQFRSGNQGTFNQQRPGDQQRPGAPVVEGQIDRGQRGFTQDLGQPYYRDAQGRFFFLDPQGGRVYVDQQRRGMRGNQNIRQPQAPQGPRGPELGVIITDSPEGIRVDRVQDQSVAAQANIQPGDVLQQFDGQQVTDPRQLQRLVQSTSPGQSVELTVLRNGQQQTLSATFPETSGGQRYDVSKPAMDGDNLQREVEQLRNEVQSLRQQMNRLHGQQLNGQQPNDGGESRTSPPQPFEQDATQEAPETATESEEARLDATQPGEQAEAVRARSNENIELSTEDDEAEAEAEAGIETETTQPEASGGNGSGGQSSL